MEKILYPTELHKKSVETINNFFIQQKNVDTILIVNSIARGKATIDSDIDMAILVSERTENNEVLALENAWEKFLDSSIILNQYVKSNRFVKIHLDIIDGVFEPAVWEQDGAVDFFEVGIGNRLVYAKPLVGGGNYFKELQLRWLPYYNDKLQSERLNLVKASCLYHLDHIPILLKRGLHFQGFDKLYIAFQKFLQALFIKHKTYPIAYNKWINEQIVEILNLPELYPKLAKNISVKNIESDELIIRAEILKHILVMYC